MAYIVIIDWDEQDAVPFGTFYTSKPLSSKKEAWAYVCRVIERAKANQAQLHNVIVFNARGCEPCGSALWCLHDPRGFGDPWPVAGQMPW